MYMSLPMMFVYLFVCQPYVVFVSCTVYGIISHVQFFLYVYEIDISIGFSVYSSDPKLN